MNLDLTETQRVLACLGDPSRFRIVAVLAEGDRCVTEIAAVVGLSQSCTTRHLQVLLRREVVSRVRQGKRVLFRLRDDDPAMALLLEWAMLRSPASISGDARAAAGHAAAKGAVAGGATADQAAADRAAAGGTDRHRDARRPPATYRPDGGTVPVMGTQGTGAASGAGKNAAPPGAEPEDPRSRRSSIAPAGSVAGVAEAEPAPVSPPATPPAIEVEELEDYLL